MLAEYINAFEPVADPITLPPSADHSSTGLPNRAMMPQNDLGRAGDDPDAAALDGDAAATLRRVVYEEERVDTDLRPETLLEKAASLRPRLVETATAGETTGYRAATEDFTIVHGARVGTVLAALGHLEDAAGRPFLSAVVVETGAELPGEWYFEMLARADAFDERVPDDEGGRRAVWSTQILDVWQYPWE